MNDNKKMTRSGAGTPKRIKMGAETGQAATSISDSITSAPAGQAVHIADFLGYGQNSAVPLRHIKQMVDLPGREIRRQIQAEREQHIPIVSDHHGYYLAADAREKERFVRGMKRRAAEIVKVAEAMHKMNT